MKKQIFISIALSSVLISSEYEGDISIESSYLNHNIKNKRDYQNALCLNTEIQQDFEKGKLVVGLKAIRDLKDEERRYFDFNDFYYKHNFENGDLLIGRNTRFWGAITLTLCPIKPTPQKIIKSLFVCLAFLANSKLSPVISAILYPLY